MSRVHNLVGVIFGVAPSQACNRNHTMSKIYNIPSNLKLMKYIKAMLDSPYNM
jgi:hypothetical protein